MSSTRVYREACRPEYIRQELEEGKRKQFDPKLVNLFIKLWDHGALDSIMVDDSSDHEEITDGPSVLLQRVVIDFASQNMVSEKNKR